VECPRFVPVCEELMLGAAGTLQPVVDRIGGDRSGQRSEICGRRTGQAGELLEAPVGQGHRLAASVVYDERFG
jgi:hypothetical protein